MGDLFAGRNVAQIQMRGYAFVVVALQQGRPMHCIYRGKGAMYMGTHVLRISCRLQVICMYVCILVMCGARKAIMRFMKDVRIRRVLLERRKCMY